MFKFITIINSLLCFTIMVNYVVFYLQHNSASLSTFLINPMVGYIVFLSMLSLTQFPSCLRIIALITKMFINILVCFVANITSCCSSRHSITYINKLCQSYG